MKIAIASGKGGTGKTTIAVNLALSLKDAQLFDCDVEEPNCNLFLGYDLEKVEDVNVPTPVIDKSKCDLCGKCSEFCQFNALAVLPEDVMIFPTLCHGCGGCSIVCPNEAISEVDRKVGVIEGSTNEDLVFYQGLLKIGEPMTSLVIKALQEHIDKNTTAIIDAPPGTACPVIASVKNVDYCILVTESTPFGFHDLKLALDVMRILGIPFGVVINQCDIGDNRVEEYCIEEEIPVLMKIPYDREIARLYSQGIPFVNEMPEWKDRFVRLFRDVTSLYEMRDRTEQ
ncbi:MinD superfamily P-loop ATPase, contains an inserted ferredoxin domain [Methanococcoides vulcani]|uniref:MinD superfamily P-loop ATPase, contains an inserted ferredoxin domain n=1 Tax=Methanococcoides vulcani TaxID=1353158 RepID=A0A1H9ZWX4_9EURY|nr:ATP-binding protein [Methanococcoides vulcani]SES85875.1 MinD superfamily P-loop ATPase, contains an inserted ferredoxin domain [Methanococcoides vulcani]